MVDVPQKLRLVVHETGAVNMDQVVGEQPVQLGEVNGNQSEMPPTLSFKYRCFFFGLHTSFPRTSWDLYQPFVRATIELKILTGYIAGLRAAQKCAGIPEFLRPP